jgi:hypothetical protein
MHVLRLVPARVLARTVLPLVPAGTDVLGVRTSPRRCEARDGDLDDRGFLIDSETTYPMPLFAE